MRSLHLKLLSICVLTPINLALAVPTTAPSTVPATTPSTTIDQSKLDAALAKLQQRQADRAAAPATLPAVVFTSSDYPRDLVAARKLELVHQYDTDIFSARQALRRHELLAADVRDLVAEQTALLQLQLDKFRDLLMEADSRNAQRTSRFHDAFGELEQAAATVVNILMKSGVVDSAQSLPDDPLSQDIEEAHGVRRVYFRFILPSTDSTGMMRRHNGFIEFQLAQKQGPNAGLWLPTWADLQGEAIPLFDLEAFAPLRPYRIFYDGVTFVVAQESPLMLSPPQTFSLMSVRNGEAYRRVGSRGFVPVTDR